MFSGQKQNKIKNWILIIQIIVPIYNREDYQINNVIKYMELSINIWQYNLSYRKKLARAYLEVERIRDARNQWQSQRS